MRVLIFILLCSVTAFSQIPAIEPGVSQELAKWRASQYSNISYKLNLTLEKMSPVLRGSMEIHVTQAATACAEPNCPPMAIILDWRKIPGHEKDSTISNDTLNGQGRMIDNGWTEWMPPASLFTIENEHIVFQGGVKPGENVIKLDFTSPILTSGSAITRYVDKEDGAEYIYSLFVPSDASTAFPVFDQPDLKAKFWLKLDYMSPGWKAVSNMPANECFRVEGADNTFGPNGTLIDTSCYYFEETKPISTYVFAFAAGPFEKFDDTGGNASVNERALDQQASQPNRDLSAVAPTNTGGTLVNTRVSARSSIYVRKSQAAKFKPHAAEIFRLNREAVKYLETYFDYKFPFPKYDLVLIPEFPFGGMEHAGATFLREQSVIFPQEPTKNDIITRANLIFHEAAHQWFGDTVTMKWFDDLWLKEGFAEFMAYKTLEKVMPDANAWKVFYERNKRAAYATDSTKGTTPIYQPIANLNSAKSAYGNIVYRKAPSFLRQAEFYLGEDKFQTAVRAFLKKHEFANAGWEDLVKEFEAASGKDLRDWAKSWVTKRGLSVVRGCDDQYLLSPKDNSVKLCYEQVNALEENNIWPNKLKVLYRYDDGTSETRDIQFSTLPINEKSNFLRTEVNLRGKGKLPVFTFLNYNDFGYGIFLNWNSQGYVLKNIQNEKDDFLRTMMWGSLWDSVREAELDPKDYVELVIKNLSGAQARTSVRAVANRGIPETDESTIQTLLGRVSTAMNYYLPAPSTALTNVRASAKEDLQTRLENLLIDKIQNASTQGQRITYYRAFLNIASTERARNVLKQILKAGSGTTKSSSQMTLKTKDKFDIVTRLAILGDPDAPKLLSELEKTETSDDAKRYAYAAHAAFATAENKAKFWNDFVNNKDISESWIEAAAGPFNSIRHSALTLPYLEKALAMLPALKRERKIFFVNDWLGDFLGGQRDEKALAIINKFLADNPNLDNDLRLKILENSDVIERAVKIRAKYKN